MEGKWFSFKTKQLYDSDPGLEDTFRWDIIPNPGKGPYFCFPDGTVELKDTEVTGKALFAARDIKAGELIWHYDIYGKETEILSVAELWAMPRKERLEWYVYAWHFDQNLITGPRRDQPLEENKQKDAINFLNHSCEPNVVFDGALNVRAYRDIKKGEMMSYDYMTSESNVAYHPFQCACGTKTCRGTLSSFDYRLPEYQKKYAGKMFPLVTKTMEKENMAKLGQGPYRELNVKLEAKPCADDILGKGLFASQKIQQGEPVWIDLSPWKHPEKPMTLQQINSLPEKEKEFAITYGQEVDTDLINVPEDVKTVENNFFYLINHSCDPNTIVHSSTMWTAFRDIQPGEEITIDYSTLGHQIQRIPEKCVCGTSCCRGSVSKDDWKNLQLQKKYGPAWRPHVLALIWNQNQIPNNL